jgi:hypothetical protein
MLNCSSVVSFDISHAAIQSFAVELAWALVGAVCGQIVSSQRIDARALNGVSVFLASCTAPLGSALLLSSSSSTAAADSSLSSSLSSSSKVSVAKANAAQIVLRCADYPRRAMRACCGVFAPRLLRRRIESLRAIAFIACVALSACTALMLRGTGSGISGLGAEFVSNDAPVMTGWIVDRGVGDGGAANVGASEPNRMAHPHTDARVHVRSDSYSDPFGVFGDLFGRFAPRGAERWRFLACVALNFAVICLGWALPQAMGWRSRRASAAAAAIARSNDSIGGGVVNGRDRDTDLLLLSDFAQLTATAAVVHTLRKGRSI